MFFPGKVAAGKKKNKSRCSIQSKDKARLPTADGFYEGSTPIPHDDNPPSMPNANGTPQSSALGLVCSAKCSQLRSFPLIPNLPF